MTKQIILRPSQPWPLCPGSVSFVAKLRESGELPAQEKESEVATLGTRAHYWSEATIKSLFYPADQRAYWKQEAEEAAQHIPENYLENASKYVHYVTDVLFGREHVLTWGVETKVSLWYEPNHKGTVDFWYTDGDTLHVLDYKSGRVEVSPKDNTQLVSYACALIDERALLPRTVLLGIIQPFVGGFYGHEPKWWTVSIEELTACKQELTWLAKEARNPLVRSRLIPGEKQCRFCAAKPVCPAIKDQIKADFISEPTVDAMTEDELLAIWDRAKYYRDFLDAIEDRLVEMNPDTLAKYGWKLQQGNRRFSWSQEETALSEHLKTLGVDPYKQTLKTPTQVREELGTDEGLSGWYEVERNRPTLKRVR